MRRQTTQFWDVVRLILENWRHSAFCMRFCRVLFFKSLNGPLYIYIPCLIKVSLWHHGRMYRCAWRMQIYTLVTVYCIDLLCRTGCISCYSMHMNRVSLFLEGTSCMLLLFLIYCGPQSPNLAQNTTKTDHQLDFESQKKPSSSRETVVKCRTFSSVTHLQYFLKIHNNYPFYFRLWC